MAVELLPEERWHEVADILKTEFDAELPHSGKAHVMVRLDDEGKIVGLMVIEFLCRIGQIWNCGPETRGMFKWVDEQIPPGNSVIAIASEPRFRKVCEAFGMREVEGTVFRKDY